MYLQWDWLCLGVLIISSVTAEAENKDTPDSSVEVEDFDKQSQEADVDGDKSSLEVRWQKSLVKACLIIRYVIITTREIDGQMYLKKSELTTEWMSNPPVFFSCCTWHVGQA